jgi:hypothetical protein
VMTGRDPTMQAHEAIGRFSCIFSELDYELGETAKVIFRLTDHEAADAIVALADFTKKVNLIKSALEFARRPDRTELPKQWKQAAQKTLSKILTVNTNDRVQLAHSRLQPQSNGSVLVTRLTAQGQLKIEQIIWTQDDFRNKCSGIEKLINDLKDIRNQLSTLVFVFGLEQPQNLKVWTNVIKGSQPAEGPEEGA